ncbi:phospholipid-transporting ATPase IF-like [Panulirus ornatus]|uniref:phospholipid-transporting ATPase IF-like n=1 Tax=Panulirus ornatus TaxID=150431 RepID=UPI003A8A5502
MVPNPFKRKRQPLTCRRVLVNRQQPEDLDQPVYVPRYQRNRIKTSKYSVISFVPKNLFEQFRRIANLYFLCVAIIQLSIESPVSPMTSLLPLVVVITVTAVKQAYEDWLRHCEDTKVNNAPSRVLRDGVITNVRTRDIEVGDIVEVSSDEQFPCDLLLVMSSDPECKCYVTTANLDGETNLKTFVSPQETRHLSFVDDLWKFRAIIECQLPHANLYDFTGRLEVYRGNAEPARAPLGTENLLLRGARLKNTTTVYGVAIYTGKDTKMALNSKMVNKKFSTVEKSMNNFLVFFLVVLLLEVLVCTVIKYQVYDIPMMKRMWYLGIPVDMTVTARDIVQDSFSFLIIFNYIIPISLYVTLEMQKFVGAMFIEWDDELKCSKTGERSKCNTSDLNEELGQVQYLFTDKTGTLTENCMNFRQCSVHGVKYADVDGEIQELSERNSDTTQPLHAWPVELETFLETLALCHTVQVTLNSSAEVEDPMNKTGIKLSKEYQAASPDEKALVEACARFGVVFDGQLGDKLHLTVRGQTRVFKQLQVLEFDSDRKCMSVVVRDEASERIWLLTKGAESSVLRRCRVRTADEHAVHDATLTHINHYAMVGLRTLAVAKRELSNQQYKDLSCQLSEAKQMLEGREEAVKEVMNRMEAELSLLGATGVEDLLQEGVQETLEALRVAGIKVWVLTGDKVETAVNIAYSCGHFKKFMTILSLTGLQDPEHAASTLQQCHQESEEDCFYGLVVDGTSLQMLLDHHRKEFYRLCRRCTAVVCCRMSPRQKAETVRLVKKSKESPVCAAIGDGANDVSMIQEAHVGLGVMGKEGRQAVRCSDFAFARFKFLKKVLLVHGHWYYVRVSTLVQYFFYKNAAFITPQIFFAVWNAFSTQSVYDSLSLTLYNITFTSLPVLVYGLFEQNLPPAVLMDRPQLYRSNANNAAMSWLNFFRWTAFALWHTSVMYFGLMLVCMGDTCGLPYGQTSDLNLFGTTLVSICVFVVNLKLVLVARYLTQFFLWSLVITAVGYATVCLLYQGFLIELFENFDVYWIYYRMFESSALMLASVLLGVVCLLPDLLEQVYWASRDERMKNILRKKTRSVSLRHFSGYANEAFDQREEYRGLWELTRYPEGQNVNQNKGQPGENGSNAEKLFSQQETNRVTETASCSLKGSWSSNSIII